MKVEEVESVRKNSRTTGAGDSGEAVRLSIAVGETILCWLTSNHIISSLDLIAFYFFSSATLNFNILTNSTYNL